MPTRYNSKSTTRFGVPGIRSGYDGMPSSEALAIPSVGIEDADRALFDLFDKEIPLQVSTSDKNREELKRVPVIFAAAEKWALAKRRRALRDKNGSLILPLITVVRTTIQQTPNEDIAGRGINQQTGEIVIKRRLNKSDRAYQGLINKLLVKHQTNVAVSPAEAEDGQVSTTRNIGELLTDDPTTQDGGLLATDLSHNIYEFLTFPAPQFYTALYEVTLWAQYTVQMFQLIEQLISSFLPQGNAWRLDTPKGYWFIATIDGNVFNAENNVDDMSQEERMIKYKFTVKVPGYILATSVPGAPIPIRRYVSSPSISFDVSTDPGELSETDGVDDPFLGSDDPTLPMSVDQNKRRDLRETNSTRLYPHSDETSVDDPALRSIPRGSTPVRYKKVTGIASDGSTVTKYVRIISTNKFTGETVYAPDADLGALNIVAIEG